VAIASFTLGEKIIIIPFLSSFYCGWQTDSKIGSLNLLIKIPIPDSLPLLTPGGYREFVKFLLINSTLSRKAVTHKNL
jgi:hypothetical protein